MSTLNEILTFEHESEHVLEHNLPLKNHFSAPKIYTAKGDLSKRWYVYFSYRNPQTGRLQRLQNIYGKANNHKTKEDRLFVLTVYKRNLLKLLKEGFNPFEDNGTLLAKRRFKNAPSTKEQEILPLTSGKQEPAALKMTLKEAFEFGLKLKEKLLNATTKRTYENRIKNFLKWVQDVHSEITTIDQLDRKLVTTFLNHVLDNTSARNRNNFRVDLSSLIQVLEDNDIVPINFVKRIPVLKTIPQRNKTYTKERQEEIYKYLEQQDTLLLLYIKFISYNFLRPIEVCRLKIGDIDLKNKTIQFKAKNSPLKTKIIPDLLLNDLPDLSKMDSSLWVFTPDKIGGEWGTTINNRRDYFSKRFKKVVKGHFGVLSH